MSVFFSNLLELSLEAAPWLLFGLIIGGTLKAWLPTDFLERHLAGTGLKPIAKAAFIGAPLPLCSCGVIPAALSLRRAGASKPSTVSFLVSTPETGVDSVTISYALLGPVMAITRPIAAITSAIISGFLVEKIGTSKTTASITTPSTCCSKQSSCCNQAKPEAESWLQKTMAGMYYTFSQLYSDIVGWLAGGLVFAALVQTYLSPTFLAEWGSGLFAMVIMALIGIPMYVCATASTPIAAGLMLAGISPGTALVFLMAGPATNIATLGVIGKELGKRTLTAYLSGVIITAFIAGLLLDYLVTAMNIDIQTQLNASHEMLPSWISWGALILLLAIAIYSLFNKAREN